MTESFQMTNVAVSERKDGANQFSHLLPIPFLTLADFGDFPAPDKINEKEVGEGDTKGIEHEAEYTDVRLQFLQECVSQRIANICRSKDKAGGTVATNWTELLEGGGTRYPVLLKAFREKLAEFLTHTSLSADAAKKVMSYTQHNLLAETSQGTKDKVGKIFQAFANALGEEAEEYKSIFTKLEEAITSEEVEELDLDI